MNTIIRRYSGQKCNGSSAYQQPGKSRWLPLRVKQIKGCRQNAPAITHYSNVLSRLNNCEVCTNTSTVIQLWQCLGWYGHLMVLYKNTYIID